MNIWFWILQAISIKRKDSFIGFQAKLLKSLNQYNLPIADIHCDFGAFLHPQSVVCSSSALLSIFPDGKHNEGLGGLA